MKKKILIVCSICIVIIAVVLVFVFSNQTKYKIRISLIDDYSPDRILTVYNEKDEKIDVKRIEYTDGTLLCNGYNTTVHFGDIENETILKIILKDNSEEEAKIIKDEVK